MQTNLTTECKRQDTPSIIYAGSRIVGSVEGETFRKVVSGSRHFMRKPPGIGSDISSLEDAAKAGAVWLQVCDRETGNVYTARIETAYSKGIERDFGFGRQVILPFRYWRVSKGADEPVAQLALPLVGVMT